MLARPKVPPAGRGSPRGFALAVSIFALVIIAALVTGAFFAARQEMAMGVNSRTSLRAFSAAEAGVNQAMVNWNIQQWNGLAVGDSGLISGNLGAGAGTFAGSVRRLNQQLFIIRAVGTDPTSRAQRTLAMLARLQYVQMQFHAALTARGQLAVGGSSFIDGRDDDPSGWDCSGIPKDTLPGITVPTTAEISYQGCNNQSCIAGDPKILVDPTITDSTFFKFGEINWNDLVAMATVSLPGGNYKPAAVGTAITCTWSNLLNWGDPMKPPTVAGCAFYFPIIHISGNLIASQGYGQGILLVDGDLEVQGGFEFYGPVIARGHLKTTGNGNHFYGGVMAADVDLEQNSVLGNAVVTYSSCALATALKYNAPGRPIKERSWGELY